MTYHLTTFGCQMNHSDSERINSLLAQNNFKPGSLAKADLVIFNLCSVRQSAVDRVWGKIREIKQQPQPPIIALTGCILAADKNKFLNKVDLILNITELALWPQIIGHYLKVKKYKKIKPDGSLAHYFKINPQRSSAFQAYLPIMTGCNNFCSYCAVPYVRGREQSRPTKDILHEVSTLIEQGYKEIILLGQNVNSYQGKNPQGKTVDFPTLLKAIDAMPGNYWLNFISSHPKDLSTKLINCFKTCSHLTPYLHLALQSGSNKILTKMNRRYTSADYLKLINQLRQINPSIAITTDIIVGFPGETPKDFQATANLIKKIKFDMAYISEYSPRPHTKAALLEDNVSVSDKKKRERALNQILKKTALINNKKLINQTLDVLIANKKSNDYFGKTNSSKHVKIKTTKKNLIGQFIKVKITQANPWSLAGEMVK